MAKHADGTAAIVAGVGRLTAYIGESPKSLRVTARLEDSSGRVIWGDASVDPRVLQVTRETGLPWVLQVASAGSAPPQHAAASRRNLFAAGFVLMMLVISSASYFVFRAVNRELQVARLQSAFVAAVSHEFRTPLTAMCHLTEMLERGNADERRLADYYRALGAETRRLHAMVENLLDFGRMDSGRRTYQFCQTNAVELVERVAQEYADLAPGVRTPHQKALPNCDDGATVAADSEALMPWKVGYPNVRPCLAQSAAMLDASSSSP